MWKTGELLASGESQDRTKRVTYDETAKSLLSMICEDQLNHRTCLRLLPAGFLKDRWGSNCAYLKGKSLFNVLSNVFDSALRRAETRAFESTSSLWQQGLVSTNISSSCFNSRATFPTHFCSFVCTGHCSDHWDEKRGDVCCFQVMPLEGLGTISLFPYFPPLFGLQMWW